MTIGESVPHVLRQSYWEMLAAVAEETTRVYSHNNDYVGFVLNPTCAIYTLARTAEGYMKRSNEFADMFPNGEREPGEWLNYVLEAENPENLEWLVGFNAHDADRGTVNVSGSPVDIAQWVLHTE